MLLFSLPLFAGGLTQWGAQEDSLKLNAYFPFCAWCEAAFLTLPPTHFLLQQSFRALERAIWVLMLQY